MLLAMTFRFVHVEEMLGTLTASELARWWAYYQVEPWGPQRDDGRSCFEVGMIGAAMSGTGFDSALALPGFVEQIYGPPDTSSVMQEQLEHIRGSRKHHRNQPGS